MNIPEPRFCYVMSVETTYILVRRKWKSSVLNAESHSTFDLVGSDHQVVAVKLRLSLRVPKNNSNPGLTQRPSQRVLTSSPATQQKCEAAYNLWMKSPRPHMGSSSLLMRRWVPTNRTMRTFPLSKHPNVIQVRQGPRW